MKSHITNPAYFRLKTLLALGVTQVHEFARTSVAALTTYRVILGRCLLAMRETKGFKKFGCSSEIHYATAKLGMGEGVARDCRKVARLLLELPELALAAENGWIEWGKLREIAPKATVETEVYWLKLAKDLNYRQIEKLANKTPKGGLPGDVFEETERQTSELRCKLSDEVLAMLDQARRLYSVEQGEAVTTAQVLEYALASYISNQPIDQDSLERVRREMDRDLQAQNARKVPLVAVARGVAAEMGFIPIPEAEEVSRAGQAGSSSDQVVSRTGNSSGPSRARPIGNASGSKSESLHPLAQALGAAPSPELFPVPSGETARAGQTDQPGGSAQPSAYSHLNGVELLTINDPAWAEAVLQQNQLPALSNKRVCFNPLNRHTTKAQKREVLRRDGWCCAVPGCPHRVFLHLHHLIPFSQGGPTFDKALVGLCTACHCNVHAGLLRIFQQPDGSLHFTDAEGNSLAKQADLELGRWLDFNIGWKGKEDDSFTWRAFQGKWSVHGNLPAATG